MDTSIAAMDASIAVDGNAEAVVAPLPFSNRSATDGVNGFLTPPGNPQGFAEALLELLAAPELAARKMIDDIEALYTKLLTKHDIL
jgi:glycosyltransferase involved in cell wall biosynthesis